MCVWLIQHGHTGTQTTVCRCTVTKETARVRSLAPFPLFMISLVLSDPVPPTASLCSRTLLYGLHPVFRPPSTPIGRPASFSGSAAITGGSSVSICSRFCIGHTSGNTRTSGQT